MHTMKVFQVAGEWSMDHLQQGERPIPVPGAGQVRLRMQAAALNYRDLLVPLHGYGARMQALPLVMLSDGVGVVDAVGPGVTQARIGERLCPLLFQTWTGGPPDAFKLSQGLGCERDGTMADYLVLHETGTAPAPAGLSDVEAASLPTAGLTAWRAVVTEGQIKPGDVVLVQGTGGVALFALQFAKLLGAKVICTSSSDAKLARARALGADEVINYRTTPEWGRPAKAMAQAAGKRGPRQARTERKAPGAAVQGGKRLARQGIDTHELSRRAHHAHQGSLGIAAGTAGADAIGGNG